ncbi:MAG: cyclic nucleotide-binding domain-containing protein [Gammaproteobacteria bacterium]
MPTTDLFHNATDTVRFDAGSPVFRQGDAGDRMYVVKSGELEIEVDGRVIEAVGPGSIVGEMALIDDSARSATVTARSDCELVPIDERRFMFLVQQTPHFSLLVMRVLAARLRRMDTLAAAG